MRLRPAPLTITDDAASSSPQTVKLDRHRSRSGDAESDDSGLRHGCCQQSGAKTVTLTNNQGSSLTITSITGLPAAYTQSSVANSCTPGLVVPSGGQLRDYGLA